MPPGGRAGDSPGGHLFDLVDILETTAEKWIDGIKQHSLDPSAWKCVDDLRGFIAGTRKNAEGLRAFERALANE